jgi:hypothetical protein
MTKLIVAFRNFAKARNKTYFGLHLRCPIIFDRFLTIFVLPRQVSAELPNTNFHGNPSRGSGTDNMYTDAGTLRSLKAILSRSCKRACKYPEVNLPNTYLLPVLQSNDRDDADMCCKSLNCML